MRENQAAEGRNDETHKDQITIIVVPPSVILE